jgi:hypothetical protein
MQFKPKPYHKTSLRHIKIMADEIDKYILEKHPSWNHDNELDYHDLVKSQFREINHSTGITNDLVNIMQEYTEDNITIYDPCYGSGDLVNHIVNRYNRLCAKNMYGNEIESKLLCEPNLILGTGEQCQNIQNEDCLTGYLDKRFDIIVTDVPLGLRIDYNKIKGKIKKGNNFGQIYPVATMAGELLMFQKCIHNLKDNGVFQILYHQGIMFNNSWAYRKFRKRLVETINVRSIILTKLDYTSVLVCVITMTRDGPTSDIKFTSDIDNTTKIITINDIVANDYILM